MSIRACLGVMALIIAGAVAAFVLWPRPEVGFDTHKWPSADDEWAAIQAATEFYEKIRETALEDPPLPEALEWHVAETIHRTRHGRHYVTLRAEIESGVLIEGRLYRCLTADFDLFLREITRFSMVADRVQKGTGSEDDLPLLAESERERLKGIGERFVRDNVSGEIAYESCYEDLGEEWRGFKAMGRLVVAHLDDEDGSVRTVCMEVLRFGEVARRGRSIVLHFARVVEGVHYVQDFLEIEILRTGHIVQFSRSAVWAERRSWPGEPLSEEELRARSRDFANGIPASGLRGLLKHPVRKIQASPEMIASFLAAGDARFWQRTKVPPDPLNGYLEPQLMFFSRWIWNLEDESGADVVGMLCLYLDAYTGEVLSQTYGVGPAFNDSPDEVDSEDTTAQ